MLDEHMLRYERPAATWTEALPVGNGRIGAMVFGGLSEDRIQLNDITVWAGDRSPTASPGFAEAAAEARQLCFAGRPAEAEALLQPFMGVSTGPRSHQTAGDLHLVYEGIDAETTVGYGRTLDLDQAAATVSFTADGAVHTREVIASIPHDALIIRLTADRPGRIHVTASLDRPEDFTAAGRENGLEMWGQAGHDGAADGVRWHVRLDAAAEGGTVREDQGRLRIAGADAVTLIIAIATDYHHADPQTPLTANLAVACRSVTGRLMRIPYTELRKEASAAHQRLYRRCGLRLDGPDRTSTPTDRRLADVRAGADDPGLLSLLFHYGRYLLIASSRPGSLPANLQGLWNEHLKAPWNADYHININLQMNYWHAESANLPSCHEPFFDFIERVAARGEETAARVYRCRGTVAHHTTDAWLHSDPFGNIRYGLFPHGLGWSSRSFMEAWRYRGDESFLRDRAFPLLRKVARFYLDTLAEEPSTGLLVTGPESSPENAYRSKDGNTVTICMGSAMGLQIVQEALAHLLEAAAVLDVKDSLTAEAEQALARLADGLIIGEDGRILEWRRPVDEPEPGHRHISHLYAVYPGSSVKPADARLMDAARKTLAHRLSHGGGHTGWSRAWIINLEARFRDSDAAHHNLVELLRTSMNPNLFDDHPPFQIDGNFGAAAGIIEMLIQSHQQEHPPAGPFVLDLLPALPRAWPAGEIRGVRTRGGFDVDLAWNGGKLTEARLTSTRGGAAILRYDGKDRPIALAPGESLTLGPGGEPMHRSHP